MLHVVGLLSYALAFAHRKLVQRARMVLLRYIHPVYHEVQSDQANLGQNDPVTRIRRARLGSLPKPPSLQQPTD